MRSGKQPQEQILEIWEKFYSALYVNVRLIYYATYLVNLLDLLSRRNPPRRLFCRRQRQPSCGSDYCWPLCYRDVAAVAAAADMTEGVSPPPTITFLYCVCYVRWSEGGRGGGMHLLLLFASAQSQHFTCGGPHHASKGTFT